MKLKNILTGIFALALLTTAHADVTVYVTGATAFRAGALDAIKAKFDAGTGYKYSHDSTTGNVLASTRSIFQGNFPGVTGTTTVACTFTGAVEGVKAVALPGPANNATYLTTGALPGGAVSIPGLEAAGVTAPTAAQVATLAFSDVRQSSTPITSPALQPANPRVGVVLFTPVSNNGTPANWTNVTQQQFKSLFKLGSLPLSVFTGDANDNGKFVYATGRNDGSGTRTVYMAESGLGITTLVNQFVATATTSTTITTLRRVPAANGTNASILWGQDVDGNGGYNSGSALRGDLGKTSTATTVLDADNSDLSGGPANILFMTFLSTADAVPARVAGAKILGWNGTLLSSLNSGTTLSATDKAKITEGAYTAWSYENLYYNGSLGTDQTTVYNAIKTGIPARLIASGYVEGIPLTQMNVSRPSDGAPVAP
jgi:hypothetical protein